MNLEQDLEKQLIVNDQEISVREKETPMIQSEKKENDQDIFNGTVNLMEAKIEKDNTQEMDGERGAERFFAKKELAKFLASSLIGSNLSFGNDGTYQADLESAIEAERGDALMTGVPNSLEKKVKKIDEEVRNNEKFAPDANYYKDAFLGSLNRKNKRTAGAVLKELENEERETSKKASVDVGIIDSYGKPGFNISVNVPGGINEMRKIKKIPQVMKEKVRKLASLEGCFDLITEDVLGVVVDKITRRNELNSYLNKKKIQESINGEIGK